MKLLIFYLALIIPQFAFSQIEMPDEMSVRLYAGGDYRNKGEKGSYSDIDSINYTPLSEFDIYYTGKIYQERKIFMRDEDFNEYNINEDSTMTEYANLSFKFEEMENLLYWLDEDNYSKTILRDTLTIFDDTTKYEQTDTLLISPTISITDFGIDTTNFHLECDYFNLILDKETPCDSIDYDIVLNRILKENMGFVTMSSYVNYLRITLTFKTYQITLFQQYTGDFNIKWRVKKGEEEITILSPHLNSIVSKLLPFVNRKLRGLEDYKNKEALFRKCYSIEN